jgi:hypothetical protein
MTIAALDLRDRGPKETGNSVGRSNLVEHILQEAGSAALASVRGLAAEMCHMPPKEGGLLHDGGLQPESSEILCAPKTGYASADDQRIALQ